MRADSGGKMDSFLSESGEDCARRKAEILKRLEEFVKKTNWKKVFQNMYPGIYKEEE